MRAASVKRQQLFACKRCEYHANLTIEHCVHFRFYNDIKDTLEKEPENDDLFVSVNIVKAAPLIVFVQDKRVNAVFDDAHDVN